MPPMRTHVRASLAIEARWDTLFGLSGRTERTIGLLDQGVAAERWQRTCQTGRLSAYMVDSSNDSAHEGEPLPFGHLPDDVAPKGRSSARKKTTPKRREPARAPKDEARRKRAPKEEPDEAPVTFVRAPSAGRPAQESSGAPLGAAAEPSPEGPAKALTAGQPAG